jgi:hypothetical protein
MVMLTTTVAGDVAKGANINKFIHLVANVVLLQ